MMKLFRVSSPCEEPPRWAELQRRLFDELSVAAVRFVDQYTHADGRLAWRATWPGMDGADDGYEAFGTFPLLYLLGGHAEIDALARRQWDAVTRQFADYGQIHDEFVAYYDWMHHGESLTYLYTLGLADPADAKFRERSLRFAALYTGDNPAAANWDAQHIRMHGPITGSRGPRFAMTADDWCTHRSVLSGYPAPYEDIPGFDNGGDPLRHADWTDDAIFESILTLMNRRMARSDVPLNLTATSLVTHAYLYTGDDRFRQWVLDYLRMWGEKARANDGVLPDNIGPSGRAGELMDGKWWGGYYGWRWPHGTLNIFEPLLIAGANAQLLTGDSSWLDLARSQMDLVWSQGRMDNDTFVIPRRHGDSGWMSFGPPDARMWVHLCDFAGAAEDLERLRNFPGRENWSATRSFGKGGQYDPLSWRAYIDGEAPDYPEQTLVHALEESARRLDIMSRDDGDPAAWDVHHWQEINPAVCASLAQLMLGTPGPIYHGGLLHARVLYSDPERGRPGVPPGVAALVERVTADGVRVTLHNLDSAEARTIGIRAGAFGEHVFTSLRVDGLDEPAETLETACLEVALDPASAATLDLEMRLYANRPSYQRPWRQR